MAEKVIKIREKTKIDTSDNWDNSTLILRKGEFAINEDSGELRYGDGTHTYKDSPSIVSLGNVPNVTTNNQTPTFTQASTRTNIISGEKLSTIFSKIKKFFADLKTVAFTGNIEDLVTKSHASTSDIYGKATGVDYGHVMLSDSTSSNSGDNKGIAATPSAVKAAYDKASAATTPTFTQAATRTNISSGSNLSTILGNIMKWYADLKNVAFSGSYTDLSDKPVDATLSTSGLMSAADKAKLDGIVVSEDNIYILPTASSTTLGGVKLSDSVTSTNNTGNGIAATPAAAKAAYDKAVKVGNTRIWNSSGVTAANANSWALSSYKLTMSGARNIALAYGFSYDTLVEMLGESNLLAACGGVTEFNGGVSAIIGGYGHKLNGGRAVILGGWNNIAHAYNVVCGKSCKEPTATDYNSYSGDLFVVGNGTTATRSNSFRVAANGNCYAGVAFNGTGADYNEVREWSDGNADSEDRCGYMVAFDGVKIRLAQPGDNLRKVGIISGNSCITGNNFADYWHGKYKRDIYGRYETEPVHNDAEYDEDGNIIKEEYDGYSYVLSEDYDPSLEDEYIPRLDRSEYDLMATHGEVVVRDDGTCEADGYCIPGQDGIATKDNEEIGFYVMERIDENHIRVFVR